MEIFAFPLMLSTEDSQKTIRKKEYEQLPYLQILRSNKTTKKLISIIYLSFILNLYKKLCNTYTKTNSV